MSFNLFYRQLNIQRFIMKNLFLIILTAQHFFCYGQNDSLEIKKLFRASVMSSINNKNSGYISAFTDSAIILSDKAPFSWYHPKGPIRLEKLDYSTITKIVAKRTDATGLGLLSGGLIGLGAGVIYGFSLGDDPPNIITFSAGDKGLIFGCLGAFLGTACGGIIGSFVKTTFHINRKKENFDEMRLQVSSVMYRSKPQ
jgi:hypothetical protein